MKLLAVICFLSIGLLLACNKSDKAKIEAVVIKNCSGTYVSVDTKNYQVCNDIKLKKYNDGDAVKIAYHAIIECDNNAVSCALYFQNEGYVELDAVADK